MHEFKPNNLQTLTKFKQLNSSLTHNDLIAKRDSPNVCDLIAFLDAHPMLLQCLITDPDYLIQISRFRKISFLKSLLSNSLHDNSVKPSTFIDIYRIVLKASTQSDQCDVLENLILNLIINTHAYVKYFSEEYLLLLKETLTFPHKNGGLKNLALCQGILQALHYFENESKQRKAFDKNTQNENWSFASVLELFSLVHQQFFGPFSNANNLFPQPKYAIFALSLGLFGYSLVTMNKTDIEIMNNSGIQKHSTTIINWEQYVKLALHHNAFGQMKEYLAHFKGDQHMKALYQNCMYHMVSRYVTHFDISQMSQTLNHQTLHNNIDDNISNVQYYSNIDDNMNTTKTSMIETLYELIPYLLEQNEDLCFSFWRTLSNKPLTNSLLPVLLYDPKVSGLPLDNLYCLQTLSIVSMVLSSPSNMERSQLTTQTVKTENINEHYYSPYDSNNNVLVVRQILCYIYNNSAVGNCEIKLENSTKININTNNHDEIYRQFVDQTIRYINQVNFSNPNETSSNLKMIPCLLRMLVVGQMTMLQNYEPFITGLIGHIICECCAIICINNESPDILKNNNQIAKKKQNFSRQKMLTDSKMVDYLIDLWHLLQCCFRILPSTIKNIEDWNTLCQSLPNFLPIKLALFSPTNSELKMLQNTTNQSIFEHFITHLCQIATLEKKQKFKLQSHQIECLFNLLDCFVKILETVILMNKANNENIWLNNDITIISLVYTMYNMYIKAGIFDFLKIYNPLTYVSMSLKLSKFGQQLIAGKLAKSQPFQAFQTLILQLCLETLTRGYYTLNGIDYDNNFGAKHTNAFTLLKDSVYDILEFEKANFNLVTQSLIYLVNISSQICQQHKESTIILNSEYDQIKMVLEWRHLYDIKNTTKMQLSLNLAHILTGFVIMSHDFTTKYTDDVTQLFPNETLPPAIFTLSLSMLNYLREFEHIIHERDPNFNLVGQKKAVSYQFFVLNEYTSPMAKVSDKWLSPLLQKKASDLTSSKLVNNDSHHNKTKDIQPLLFTQALYRTLYFAVKMLFYTCNNELQIKDESLQNDIWVQRRESAFNQANCILKFLVNITSIRKNYGMHEVKFLKSIFNIYKANDSEIVEFFLTSFFGHNNDQTEIAKQKSTLTEPISVLLYLLLLDVSPNTMAKIQKLQCFTTITLEVLCNISHHPTINFEEIIERNLQGSQLKCFTLTCNPESKEIDILKYSQLLDSLVSSYVIPCIECLFTKSGVEPFLAENEIFLLENAIFILKICGQRLWVQTMPAVMNNEHPFDKSWIDAYNKQFNRIIKQCALCIKNGLQELSDNSTKHEKIDPQIMLGVILRQLYTGTEVQLEQSKVVQIKQHIKILTELSNIYVILTYLKQNESLKSIFTPGGESIDTIVESAIVFGRSLISIVINVLKSLNNNNNKTTGIIDIKFERKCTNNTKSYESNIENYHGQKLEKDKETGSLGIAITETLVNLCVNIAKLADEKFFFQTADLLNELCGELAKFYVENMHYTDIGFITFDLVLLPLITLITERMVKNISTLLCKKSEENKNEVLLKYIEGYPPKYLYDYLTISLTKHANDKSQTTDRDSNLFHNVQRTMLLANIMICGIQNILAFTLTIITENKEFSSKSISTKPFFEWLQAITNFLRPACQFIWSVVQNNSDYYMSFPIIKSVRDSLINCVTLFLCLLSKLNTEQIIGNGSDQITTEYLGKLQELVSRISSLISIDGADLNTQIYSFEQVNLHQTILDMLMIGITRGDCKNYPQNNILHINILTSSTYVKDMEFETVVNSLCNPTSNTNQAYILQLYFPQTYHVNISPFITKDTQNELTIFNDNNQKTSRQMLTPIYTLRIPALFWLILDPQIGDKITPYCSILSRLKYIFSTINTHSNQDYDNSHKLRIIQRFISHIGVAIHQTVAYLSKPIWLETQIREIDSWLNDATQINLFFVKFPHLKSLIDFALKTTWTSSALTDVTNRMEHKLWIIKYQLIELLMYYLCIVKTITFNLKSLLPNLYGAAFENSPNKPYLMLGISLEAPHLLPQSTWFDRQNSKPGNIEVSEKVSIYASENNSFTFGDLTTLLKTMAKEFELLDMGVRELNHSKFGSSVKTSQSPHGSLRRRSSPFTEKRKSLILRSMSIDPRSSVAKDDKNAVESLTETNQYQQQLKAYGKRVHLCLDLTMYILVSQAYTLYATKNLSLTQNAQTLNHNSNVIDENNEIKSGFLTALWSEINAIMEACSLPHPTWPNDNFYDLILNLMNYIAHVPPPV